LACLIEPGLIGTDTVGANSGPNNVYTVVQYFVPWTLTDLWRTNYRIDKLSRSEDLVQYDAPISTSNELFPKDANLISK